MSTLPFESSAAKCSLRPMAIEPVARLYGLGFLPLSPEHYDFFIPEARFDRPAVDRQGDIPQHHCNPASASAVCWSSSFTRPERK